MIIMTRISTTAMKAAFAAMLLAAMLGAPSQAFADCTVPAGIEGEMVYNDTYNMMQFCDGTNWIGMAGGSGGGGGGGALTDGDKGDVVVSGSGVTWTVDGASISYAKIQNVSATNRLLGRASAGAGVVEEITIGSGLTLSGTTLSANGGANAVGAAGYIQFSDGAGALNYSGTTAGQQFFWDNTNHRLGVNTATPTEALDVVGKATAAGVIYKSVTGASAPASGSTVWTASGANVYRAAGSVGVGTNNPTSTLEVNGSLELAASNNLTWGGPYGSGIPTIAGSTSSGGYINFYPAGSTGSVITRISANGTVGIGTTSTAARLIVAAAGNTATDYTAEFQSSGGVAGAGGILFSQDSTYAFKAHTQGTSSSTTGRMIFGYINRSTGASVTPSILSVSGNGNVGIGVDAPGYPLHIVNDAPSVLLQDSNGAGVAAGMIVEFMDSAGTRTGYVGDESPGNFNVALASSSGSVLAKAGANSCTYVSGASWSCSSDARLKKNIEDAGASLVKLTNMRGVTFEWIAANDGAGRHYGLIAQEVEKVYPEMVSTDDKGMKSVDYSAFISPLIEAVKELNAKNIALEARLKTLEEQNAMILERLDAMGAAQ